MTRPQLTPQRRRLLTLRHRDHAWQDALDRLFDTDGKGLMYGLCLADEGVGDRATVRADFEASSLILLAEMMAARPEEGRATESRWNDWWANWCVILNRPRRRSRGAQ